MTSPDQPIGIGSWVQILYTAELSASKQGEVLWTDGKKLVAKQANGKKFEARCEDAVVRPKP